MEEKRSWNRLGTIYSKVVTIAFGALVTIFLGLKTSDGVGAAHPVGLALVLSASVTAISAWESFAGYHEKWIIYRIALYKFYDLKDHLAYLQTHKDDNNIPTDEFFNRIREILSEANQQWLDGRLTATKVSDRGR